MNLVAIKVCMYQRTLYYNQTSYPLASAPHPGVGSGLGREGRVNISVTPPGPTPRTGMWDWWKFAGVGVQYTKPTLWFGIRTIAARILSLTM